MSARLPVVTLDGPAGVGKTTLARRMAESLGLAYLDTGAMFRCMALKLGPGAEELPEEELRVRCAHWVFSLGGMGQQSTLFCNGVAVRSEVRTEEVAMLAARTGLPVHPVEALGWNGDALEAEAFGWLAVRHLKGLPLSWPETTGVPVPTPGGRLARP